LLCGDGFLVLADDHCLLCQGVPVVLFQLGHAVCCLG
jgi:hypothetical protein